MGDVVNLNRFRKRKARTERAAIAERNRLLHGRTAAERRSERLERQRAERELQGKRLDGPGEQAEPGDPDGPDED